LLLLIFYEIITSSGKSKSIGQQRLVVNEFVTNTRKRVLADDEEIDGEAFFVDHTDEDKSNNKASNLQYLTNKENIVYIYHDDDPIKNTCNR
jgi:hypothetical protein